MIKTILCLEKIIAIAVDILPGLCRVSKKKWLMKKFSFATPEHAKNN